MDIVVTLEHVQEGTTDWNCLGGGRRLSTLEVSGAGLPPSTITLVSPVIDDEWEDDEDGTNQATRDKREKKTKAILV